jgi:hypothetical protein
LDRPVIAALFAALLIMVVAGRAVSGQAATWLDVVAVGVAAAVLVLTLLLPTSRRRRSSSTVYRRPSTQRVDNQVLGGGHSAWSAPAGRAVVASSEGAKSVGMRELSAKPRTTHIRINMRLAVAEELLEAHGLTADYRAMVSAVEQDG